jgi:hypothetical protein
MLDVASRDTDATHDHRETLKRVLNLSPATTMEYKSNNGKAIHMLSYYPDIPMLIRMTVCLQTRCRIAPASGRLGLSSDTARLLE